MSEPQKQSRDGTSVGGRGNGSGSDRSALFDDVFLRKLAGLKLVVRRWLSGRAHGTHQSRRLGRGLEFADHRGYVPGDDLRHLDWNLYARLERPMVRLHEQESDLALHILVDASTSMGLGEPPKLDLALQIAASLAHIGLCNTDRVSIHVLHPEAGQVAREGAIGSSLQFIDGLARVTAGGTTDLETSVRAFLALRPRRGLVVLLSDFFNPAGQEKAVGLLSRHRFETAIVAINSPEEVEPTLSPELEGDVVLVDCETGEERIVAVTPDLLSAYRRSFNAANEALARYCLDHHVPAFRILSRMPFEDAVLKVLGKGGLLR